MVSRLPAFSMTCTMPRVCSGRLLLGRQLFSSNGAGLALRPPSAAAVAFPHRLCSVATPRGSAAWKPLQPAPTSGGFWSRRGQCGSRESRNWSPFLALQTRCALIRRHATAGESGGGGGSGIGNRGGGGGGGGGGGDGAGGGSGAGGEGRWRIWTWYLGLLDTNPILTKAVTSAILTFIGDVFCQYSLEKAETINGNRTAAMTFLGFGLVGPSLHFWYTTLSKLVTVGGPAGVGIRLVLDQFVFAPFSIAVFISALMTLEGNPKQITAKLKQDWWAAVLVNWQLWVPAQIINFWLVPLKLQVGFANFTALFWNAYLSWKSHLEIATPESVSSGAKT